MKQIIIKFIPHSEQRIGEPADWWFDENDDLQVRVTDMKDWRYNFLCGRHEMDEAVRCKFLSITTQQVDAYCNTPWPPGELPPDPDSFSGYPRSPHQIPHNDALAAEWVMSRLLNVDWQRYAAAFEPFWNAKHPPSPTPSSPSPTLPPQPLPDTHE